MAACAVALLATAVGCKTGSGSADGERWPSFRYKKCSEQAPCPTGFGCKSGRCISDNGRFVMTTTSCESGEQCGFGMACLESACVVDMLDCVSDFDCVDGEACVDGSCVEEARCVRPDGQPCYDFRPRDD
ncbi:MAG: hypothetical protein ACQEVA_07170 [Myxococcota bacterium]